MKIIIFLSTFLLSLYAHPHTFIEVYPSATIKDTKFTTLHFKWVLDDMTSTILITELDTNANGKIDKNENAYIEKEYFSMFKSYKYYTYIKVNNKDIKVQPQNFKATIQNNKLCYSFEVQGDFSTKNTFIEFGDSDYYVAMVLKDEFVKIENAKTKISRVDNDLYYGYRLEFK